MSRPIDTRAKLRTRASLLGAVERAIASGASLMWGDGERTTRTRILRELGVELVSRTRAAKRGHVLKRGAVPVAIAYYGAPLQRHVELYALGIQTRAKPR